MDNACLHDGLLPDCADRIRPALEPVADQHAYVPDTAVLDLRQHAEPELGAFPVAVLPGPQAEDVPLAVHGDAQGQVDGTVGDLALADLHVVGSDQGAVPGFLLARFPGPSPAPDVPVSGHPALHKPSRRGGVTPAGAMGRGSPCPGSGSAWCAPCRG